MSLKAGTLEWIPDASHPQPGSGFTGSSNAQMVLYTTTDPNTDGVVPADLNSPAIAYKADGSGSTFTWDTSVHTWR